jgi:hypothetical protein
MAQPTRTDITIYENSGHITYTTVVRGAIQVVVIDKTGTQTAQETALGNAAVAHSRLNYDSTYTPTGPGGSGSFNPPQ